MNKQMNACVNINFCFHRTPFDNHSRRSWNVSLSKGEHPDMFICIFTRVLLSCLPNLKITLVHSWRHCLTSLIIKFYNKASFIKSTSFQVKIWFNTTNTIHFLSREGILTGYRLFFWFLGITFAALQGVALTPTFLFRLDD